MSLSDLGGRVETLVVRWFDSYGAVAELGLKVGLLWTVFYLKSLPTAPTSLNLRFQRENGNWFPERAKERTAYELCCRGFNVRPIVCSIQCRDVVHCEEEDFIMGGLFGRLYIWVDYYFCFKFM